ncbi:MAG TPA: HAMP domain-containing protein, partial [Desulfopila sp.]|nr:HAMP domain-containing protein [Desulfopila sp.]
MTQRKLIWQIFPANLVILILTVFCIAWFTRSSLETFYLEELEDGLVARAYLIRPPVASMLKRGAIGELRDYSKLSGRESTTRITVIMADGKVVADSNENPATMEPHHKRVEIRQALGGGIGSSLRYSKTLGKEMLYVAIPVHGESQKDAAFSVMPEVTAVLRMAVTVDAIEVAMQRIYSRVLFGLAALAVLAAFASLLVSRNISRPLEEMKKAAERFSRGDFSGRMSTFKGASASLEVSTLASAMDRMAAQLGERIETIRSQRNELETVFSSMVESVIAVDSSERVLNLNSAAARLLGMEREAARGKIIQ